MTQTYTNQAILEINQSWFALSVIVILAFGGSVGI